MKDALRRSADRLRLQAMLAICICMLMASTLPGVTYYYVFRWDTAALGPFAWGHWGVVGAAGLTGLLAHGVGNKVLLAAHAALCCMLAAALGGFDTAFWYTLTTRCGIVQAAFFGCQQCPCAANGTCSALDLATDPLCTSCVAYPFDACARALQLANQLILAFTGLAAVVFLAVPALYSILVLGRLEASGAAAAARLAMLSFSVDQQTTLVESADKPTVTPAMLATWVGILLDSGDSNCVAVGEKCCTALAQRGFDLPVVRRPVGGIGRKQQQGKALRREKSRAAPRDGGTKGGGDGGIGAQEVVADATGEAYSLAEAGGGGPQRHKSSARGGGGGGSGSGRVAAEEEGQRSQPQFLAQRL